jgi:hypothetical protein
MNKISRVQASFGLPEGVQAQLMYVKANNTLLGAMSAFSLIESDEGRKEHHKFFSFAFGDGSVAYDVVCRHETVIQAARRLGCVDEVIAVMEYERRIDVWDGVDEIIDSRTLSVYCLPKGGLMALYPCDKKTVLQVMAGLFLPNFA